MSTELEALQGIMQDIVKLGYKRSGTKKDLSKEVVENSDKDEEEAE